MIDYNNFVDRNSIDFDLYNQKFISCIELQQTPRDDIAKDSQNFSKKYRELLNDKTTFAYLLFKQNDKLVKLYPYQDLIINDSHRFKIFRAANQIGKSYLLDVEAAINLCTDHGHAHNEAIISKSLPQAQFQMRRVKSLLDTAKFDWKSSKGSADSMQIISVDIKDKEGNVKYTNLFICVPCTEAALGYDLHKINLDEFEYWDVDIDYFFNQIAEPRTYHTKGAITIYSNPNGSDNIVSEMEQELNADGDKAWHTYIFNYLDCPGNTREEWDNLKKRKSRSVFESTVAAIRTRSSHAYFSPDEIEKSCDLELNAKKETTGVGKYTFWFLDVGKTHDQSVLVGGYTEPDLEEKFNHLYIFCIHVYPQGYPISMVVGSPNLREEDNRGWEHHKSVKDYLDEYKNDSFYPTFGCDVTGNSGISPLFESTGINPVDINFSGPEKSGMYQRFKYLLEKGLLHRVKHKQWESQANWLTAVKSMRGYLMIHNINHFLKKGSLKGEASDEHFDDCMDATAGFIKLADDPDYVPASLEIFRR